MITATTVSRPCRVAIRNSKVASTSSVVESAASLSASAVGRAIMPRRGDCHHQNDRGHHPDHDQRPQSAVVGVRSSATRNTDMNTPDAAAIQKTFNVSG